MLFSEKVIGRIGLYSTRYCSDRDSSLGRAWITIDGVEIFNFLGNGAWHGKLLEKEFDSDLYEPTGPTYEDCKNPKEFKKLFKIEIENRGRSTVKRNV